MIVPEQAEAIREAAVLVLAGWALENIAGRLRERGLQAAHGEGPRRQWAGGHRRGG